MKTMKRLQVAAAAASLFAIGGGANANQINPSGSLIAAEVIQPNALGDASNVRAPTWSYSYTSGPTAPASSVQHFQFAATLLGVADWAFLNDNTTNGVPGFSRSAIAATAQTIEALVGGKRVAVVGSENDIGDGTFGIVLQEIRDGDHIVGSPNFSTTSQKSVTYVFRLVNKSNISVSLQNLSLRFNTSKPEVNCFGGGATPCTTNQNDPANPYVPFSAKDSFTGAGSRFAAIYKLGSLSSPAVGHVGTAGSVNPVAQFGCDVGATRNIGLNVVLGEGVGFALTSAAIFQPNDPRNTINNYLGVGRATDLILFRGQDRQIQATNSFPTNSGGSPVNGIGGTGGGRFTFKPLVQNVTPVYGGYDSGYSVPGTVVNSPAGSPEGAGRVISNQDTAGKNGTFPTVARSVDARSARIGTLRFANRGAGALDRLVDVDQYGFKAQIDTVPTVPLLGFNSTQISGPGAAGDFSYGTPEANYWGGVDIQKAGNLVNLALNFRSKPNFSGFANPVRNAAGVGIGLSASGRLALVRGTGLDVIGTGVNATDAAQVCGAVPPTAGAGVLFATTGTGGNFAEQPAGSGNYSWSVDLSALTGGGATTQTLLGDWHICYYVDGVSNVPNTFFADGRATLFKDDPTEQTLTSCPSPLATIQGGVKVDVRHYQAVTSTNDWQSVVRVINNSETDTAVVEAQYIWDDGRYGLWGTLGTLAPRASMNMTSPQIAGLLTTAPTTLPAAQINTAVPRDVKTRLRIAADVSTIRVQNYFYNTNTGLLSEVSAAQGADFVNVDSSNRDHIDQDAQAEIVK